MPRSEKTVLVVGAGDFLGTAIAHRFAREGFHAVGTRRRGDLAAFAAAIEADGGRATGIHSDARDEAQVTALVERVEAEIGAIEAFVFNVGGNVRFPVLDTTARVYRKVWEMCEWSDAAAAPCSSPAPPRACAVPPAFPTSPAASMRCAPWRRAWRASSGRLACMWRMWSSTAPIDTQWTRELFPDWFAARPPDGVMQPQDIAEIYWHLHTQPRAAWTFETDVRPYVEPW